MMKKEEIENIAQNTDNDKLIKGYVDTVFNIWRMGKDAKLNYENNKKRLDDIDTILVDHVSLLWSIDKLFSNVNNSNANKKCNIRLKFDDTFDLEDYSEFIEINRNYLAKSLVPLKNLSKKYDRTLKILKKNGFQIMEFDGKKFNDGMSIKVLGYDSRTDVEEDTIIETVKPTIFFNDKEYLKGEVIVSKKPDDE